MAGAQVLQLNKFVEEVRDNETVSKVLISTDRTVLASFWCWKKREYVDIGQASYSSSTGNYHRKIDKGIWLQKSEFQNLLIYGNQIIKKMDDAAIKMGETKEEVKRGNVGESSSGPAKARKPTKKRAAAVPAKKKTRKLMKMAAPVRLGRIKRIVGFIPYLFNAISSPLGPPSYW